MKLINIARSILVIGYVMLVSCSSDEGGESGNGPQATGQELERQLLDTHWKLARETKVEDGTEKVLNNPYVLNTITFSGETDRAWHYLYLNNTHSGWWWIDGEMIRCQWDTGDPIGKMTDSELVMIADYDTHSNYFYYVSTSGSGSDPGSPAEKPDIGFYDFTATKTSVTVTYKIYNKDEAKVSDAKIYYGTSSNPTTGKNASVNGTLIKATISGLKAGTTYYVKCRATGAGGTTTSETSRVITAY